MASLDGLDLLFTKLGIGKWNYIFYTTSLLVPATQPGLLIGAEFMNPLPSFTCNLFDNGSTTSYNGSECFMVEEGDVVPCTSWTYDTSVFQSTVSMEWDLVCERAPLGPLFQTIFTCGSLFGSILAALAAHRYGRRAAVRLGTACTLVGVVLLTVTPWFSLVLVLRFLLGVFNTIMVYPGFLLSIEICVPRMRPILGIVLAVPYAVTMIILAGLAFSIREWRPLQAVVSLPILFTLLPVLYLVDESPRWLVVNGRLDEALKVLQRASRLNSVSLPEPSELAIIVSTIYKRQNKMTGKQTEDGTLESTQISYIEKEKENQISFVETKLGESVERGREEGDSSSSSSSSSNNKLGVEDGIGSWWAGPVALVRTSCIRKRMVILTLIWLMMSMVYLGLPLSSDAFSSPFLYMVLLGVIEMPAYTLTAPITQRLGRRLVICFCFTSCGFLLLSEFSLNLAHNHNELIYFVLTLCSYLFICTAYQTQHLQWLSSLLFGVCSVLCAVLVMLLPETNGLKLPETVADLSSTSAPPRSREDVMATMTGTGRV
ncbi:steroid transmembrane transporter SLC22A24-like isoform X2 [Panulirus ornatus]|uniref:steroid transmembrane transporter SLC22A24-like isoform X2 n=1 Tax=Panulirus ornatus TaxID=150431 RepID=UPI003A840DD1